MIENTPGPLDVVFTQYLRPDGRTQSVWIEREADVVAIAAALLKQGYHFDIEELADRMVSMTCESANEDEPPIAHELVPNGPEVPPAVDRLIRAAAAIAGIR